MLIHHICKTKKLNKRIERGKIRFRGKISIENVTTPWRNSPKDTTINTEGKYQQKQQLAPYATNESG
jgi:hypothetical protein